MYLCLLIVAFWGIMLPCTSRPSPIAAPRPPSSSAKVGGKALRTSSAPWPTSPPGPKQKMDPCRRLLQDEPLVSPQDLFCTHKTLPHGHVEAILMAMRKLGLDSLLAAKR